MKSTQLLKIVMGLALLQSAVQATLFNYQAFLNGPNEAPPNASPGSGLATIDYDDVAKTFAVTVNFSGLIGTTTAAHIHAPTSFAGTGVAGVAQGFLAFPTGVTAGSYSALIFGLSPVGEVALFNSFNAGTSYVNIHSTAFPGGEIRGFIEAVPDSSSIALEALLAVGALGIFRARRS